MKQKTITTEKATLLVVELPEEAKNVNTSMSNKCLIYDTPWSHVCADLPEGNWQLLGRIPDITETQLMLILPIHRQSIIGDVYKDFITGKYDAFDLYESLYSLLQANEVYFDNPLGDEPKITSGEYDDNGFGDIDKYQFKRDLKSWQEAQSKVWDKERTYLFIKEEYFYCKEWNNVGYICEGQCDSCRKTNDFKL